MPLLSVFIMVSAMRAKMAEEVNARMICQSALHLEGVCWNIGIFTVCSVQGYSRIFTVKNVLIS